MKTLQLFSDDALERGKRMSTEEVVRFLDDFRKVHAESKYSDGRRGTLESEDFVAGPADSGEPMDESHQV